MNLKPGTVLVRKGGQKVTYIVTDIRNETVRLAYYIPGQPDLGYFRLDIVKHALRIQTKLDRAIE